MTALLLSRRDLRRARAELRRRARHEYPQLTAVDDPGLSQIEAGVRAADIKLDDLYEFCEEIMESNDERLRAAHGVLDKLISRVVKAALMNGIIIGVMAERARKNR